MSWDSSYQIVKRPVEPVNGSQPEPSARLMTCGITYLRAWFKAIKAPEQVWSCSGVNATDDRPAHNASEAVSSDRNAAIQCLHLHMTAVGNELDTPGSDFHWIGSNNGACLGS